MLCCVCCTSIYLFMAASVPLLSVHLRGSCFLCHLWHSFSFLPVDWSTLRGNAVRVLCLAYVVRKKVSMLIVNEEENGYDRRRGGGGGGQGWFLVAQTTTLCPVVCDRTFFVYLLMCNFRCAESALCSAGRCLWADGKLPWRLECTLRPSQRHDCRLLLPLTTC